jgi:hypothetical protein
MGAFLAAITRSEGCGNYGRLKRRGVIGGDHWGSMAPEKEGAASMARQRERRRRPCSVGVVREEEGRVGCVGWTGRLAAGPMGWKLKENSFWNKNWIFEYTKVLEICRRRFRRNFDMWIVPKFF